MSLFKKRNKDISKAVEKETEKTEKEVLTETPDAVEKSKDASKAMSTASKVESHIPMNDKEYASAPSLTFNEQKSLKKSKYADKKEKYPNTYLIKNKRNGRMAEINGFSPLQACKSIGWRPRHCSVVEVKDNKNNKGE